MARLRIFRGSDTLLELGAVRPLTNVDTAAVITSASSITATIHKRSDDTQIGGTITLTHDTGGRWRGTIADDFNAALVEDLPVTIKLTADVAAGQLLYAELEGIVQVATDEDLK